MIAETKKVFKNCLSYVLFPYCRFIPSNSFKILTYHRVLNKDFDTVEPGMFVSDKTFELQLKILSDNYNVLQIDDLVLGLKNGHPLNNNTIAITFDDGWLDNYENAYPLLRKYNLPATIFLATSYINTNYNFWTDKLLHIYSHNPNSIYQNPVLSSLIKRENSILNIVTILKRASLLDKSRAIDEINRLYEMFQLTQRAFLNWHEIKEMSENNIRFGSHTHYHRPLTELSDIEIEKDLTTSLTCLKSNLINISNVFCYPGGYYNDQTTQILKRFNFDAHLLVDKDKSRMDSIPYMLPRINMHQDISDNRYLFSARIRFNSIF